MNILNVDEKLIKWNGEDFYELLDSMTEEDIEDMSDYLDFMSNRYDDGFRYSYDSNYEYHNGGDIVYDYIRHRAFDSIAEDKWSAKPDWISILLATEE